METMHCDYKNKDKPFFERKLESFIKTRSILVKKCRTENENLTNASYHISLHGETHITEEFLVTPILKDVVSCLFYEKSAQAVQSIYLSNNSVSRILKISSTKKKKKLISQLYACDAYALQMDESTDVDGLAILFVC